MQTTESIKRVTQATAEACTSAARASRDVVERGVSYTRRNPMKVLLGAVAVGALVAYALHRRQTSWQERSFTLPINRMRNWMSATAERAGDTLHDYRDRAADRAADLRERATEIAGDAMHAVRKSARGLRFWS
jgi:ElaB/YqjD/DUF883 family membrane-anchored ribosome-binding protein